MKNYQKLIKDINQLESGKSKLIDALIDCNTIINSTKYDSFKKMNCYYRDNLQQKIDEVNDQIATLRSYFVVEGIDLLPIFNDSKKLKNMNIKLELLYEAKNESN
jgi:uroporphyrinogen-III decarboxylase